jgi:hypothetical protein
LDSDENSAFITAFISMCSSPHSSSSKGRLISQFTIFGSSTSMKFISKMHQLATDLTGDPLFKETTVSTMGQPAAS